MFDVVALGELLIDFTPSGKTNAGNTLYEQNPGGAPANVAAAVSKLGGKSAFIGKVGEDKFGIFLKDILLKNGIDIRGLRVAADKAATTLAFVHIDDRGDRSFSFYRSPGADTMLETEELDYELIKSAKIFHFGSLSLTANPSRSATLEAVKFAKRNGSIISYDPNLRTALWPDLETAKAFIHKGLRYADVLKISEDELVLITGESDYEKGIKILSNMGIELVVVTLGEKGCFYRFKQSTGQLYAYDIHAVDTTGCGDAFTGAMLHSFSEYEKPLEELELKEMISILDFANAAGALCATKRGAITAMPELKDIQEYFKAAKKVKPDPVAAERKNTTRNS